MKIVFEDCLHMASIILAQNFLYCVNGPVNYHHDNRSSGIHDPHTVITGAHAYL